MARPTNVYFEVFGVIKSELGILSLDSWLGPWAETIYAWQGHYYSYKAALLNGHQSLTEFANGHLYFGFHKADTGWVYREWAPNAQALFLRGDFNDWSYDSHPLNRLDNGVWEIVLDAKQDDLAHLSRVKVRVVTDNSDMDRIPLYIRSVVKDWGTNDFSGQIWCPPEEFLWTDGGYSHDKDGPLLIYEAHIGIAQEKHGMGTYREFADEIVPRIKRGGYTAVQLMAIMEHPYYGSFGYQVSNFFAPSSRFGTPDDLKYLINKLHENGISVLLDIVHSHAVNNTREGINEFDGTDYQFFHEGEDGNHKVWDSCLFNYGKHEVVHFLLSNIKYWYEEFHLDGFRFDGITSMLYRHHGIGVDFTDYSMYFGGDTDLDSLTYLRLANELIKELEPSLISIAEDMSGMPGMALPIEDGGVGFDYRLAMGLPDLYERLASKTADEDYDMRELWDEHTGKRQGEKRVAYCESHDQAFVGGKTLFFHLCDAEVYHNMGKECESVIIDRGVALHKLFRLLTITLGGEAYLNFMGNEFGHPEWIDLPCEEDRDGYQFARRQWSLVDNKELKYEYLSHFDMDMLSFVKQYGVLSAQDVRQIALDNEKKILICKKGDLYYVFNFNAHQSFADYCFLVEEQGEYSIVLDSDNSYYGGFGRVDDDMGYATRIAPWNDHDNVLQIYLPTRTALVFKKMR